MRNRFGKRKGLFSTFKDVLLPVVIIAAVLLTVSQGIKSMDGKYRVEQYKSATNAVNRAVVQCYVLEGRYPPNIKYLQDNYALAIDTSKYHITYDIFASNVMPTVRVNAISAADRNLLVDTDSEMMELNEDLMLVSDDNEFDIID